MNARYHFDSLANSFQDDWRRVGSAIRSATADIIASKFDDEYFVIFLTVRIVLFLV